jgi:hypothetical protein
VPKSSGARLTVIVPKERITENSSMTHDPRPHIHRRRHAIDRLRSLTVGAAVAGLAATAGFGVLAAASWSGVAKAADDTGATTNDTSGTYGSNGTGTGSTGTSGATPTNRPKVAPNTGGTSVPPATATPRVQRSSGSGHASSGGSH